MPELSLKAARVNAKLTQKQAALRIGVSESTVKSWEKGKTSPTMPKLKKMAEVYGIPYDWLDV